MVYKQDEQFRSWLNGLYPVRMVEAVTTFVHVAAYQAPWGYLVASFLHVFIIVHVKAIDQWSLTALKGLVAWRC